MMKARKMSPKRFWIGLGVVQACWIVFGTVLHFCCLDSTSSDRKKLSIQLSTGEAWIAFNPLDCGFDPPPPDPLGSYRPVWEDIQVLVKKARRSSLTESELTRLINYVESSDGKTKDLALSGMWVNLTGMGANAEWTDTTQRQKVVDVVCKSLKEPSELNRATAAEILAQYEATDKAPQIFASLPLSKIYGSRWSLLKALQKLASVSKEPAFAHIPEAVQALPVLRESLKSKEYENFLQASALDVLGHIGPAAASAVQDILGLDWHEATATDHVWHLGVVHLEEAIHALKLIGAAAVPQLEKALNNNDKEIRRKAAVAMGEIGPDANAEVSPLQDLLKDPEPKVREAAAEALRKMGR